MSHSAVIADIDALLPSVQTDAVRALLNERRAAAVTAAAAEEKAKAPASVAPAAPAPTATAPTAPMVTPALEQIRGYAWDETEKAVKLYLKVPGATKNGMARDNVTCAVSGDSVVITVLVPGATLQAHQLRLSPLKGELQVVGHDGPTLKFKEGEVVVSLLKAKPGKWFELVDKMKKSATSKAATAKGGDEEKDAGAHLRQMMQQMYDDGDDEMKRTIGKAWAEGQAKNARGDM